MFIHFELLTSHFKLKGTAIGALVEMELWSVLNVPGSPVSSEHASLYEKTFCV